MNLQEQINRMKSMMGLIVEANNRLPYTFVGGHTGKDCDSLHGFQLEKNDANMMVIVKNELEKFKGQGVWVSDVSVQVNDMDVTWKVTIDRSSDGEFWNGFTSRGAGCNSNIQTRWNSDKVGNGPESIKNKIKEVVCDQIKDFELLKKIEFTNLGDNSFIQGFYRYKCGYEPQKNDNKEIEGKSQNLNKKTVDIVHNDNAEKLRSELKNLKFIYNPKIYGTPEKVTVKYDTTGSEPVSLSYIYSNEEGGLEDVLKTVEKGNIINSKIPYTAQYDGYIIVIKK